MIAAIAGTRMQIDTASLTGIWKHSPQNEHSAGAAENKDSETLYGRGRVWIPLDKRQSR